MTAEIAMLNSEAVALAADSAVSFSTGDGFKVLPSANKIFTLSKYHPVGAMIYGNAALLGAPWELLVKSYRRQLGTRSFARLEDYAADLIRYLEESRPLFAESTQDRYVLQLAREALAGVLKAILDTLQARVDDQVSLDVADIKAIQSDVIRDTWETWEGLPLGAGMSPDFSSRAKARYDEGVRQVMDDVFEQMPLSPEDADRLVDIALCFATKLTPEPSGVESGLVVAGYGDEDYYPVLRSYRIEAVVCNELVRTDDREHNVMTMGAGIVPFAQSEMVHAFMQGVEPHYQNTVEAELASALNRFAELAAEGIPDPDGGLRTSMQELAAQTSSEFATATRKFRMQYFAQPSIQITSMLPKDELAAMAESLVNLTAFRRRMSMDAETVGGPVDVAVISKGDGFIWIKRKHYFSKDLNPHFVQNYFRGSTSA